MCKFASLPKPKLANLQVCTDIFGLLRSYDISLWYHNAVNPFLLGAQFFFSPKIGFTTADPQPKTNGRSQDSPTTNTADRNHQGQTSYHRPSLIRSLLLEPTTIYSPFRRGREEIGVDFSLRRWPPWHRWLHCLWWFGVLTPCTLPLRIVLTTIWSRIRHLWLQRIARDSPPTQTVILCDDGRVFSAYKTHRYRQ